MERYVGAESKRERLYLEEDIEDLPWIGVITDGKKWWIWSIIDGEFSKTDYQGTVLDETNADRIIAMFDRKVGLDWAPSDISDFFGSDLGDLRALYGKKSALQATKTKKKLWHTQLRISGNAPRPEDEDELFVLHSFMIVVSACIANTIAPDLPDEKQLGFAEWVRADSDPEWYDNMTKKTGRYNWKQRQVDVLRKMYMDLVSDAHRKIYGEFYTPDWLAEKLCMEVIDDGFILAMIGRYYEKDKKPLRILDPACGSGTFLFHAIRRVLDSKPLLDNDMNRDDVTNMLVKSVCGVDIHPVATYMARTNILRALPTAPTRPLRVWQGDSLQTARSGNTLRLGEDKDTFVIYSGRGRQIVLPKAFLLKDNAMDRITRLVNTANDGKPFPAGIEAGLTPDETSVLKETHGTLATICSEEGNSVWAWYIINQAGPFILMHDRVGKIVSNPPWVVLNNIQVESRKEEIINAAKASKFWVGGKNATSFDIASLFVDRCVSLYLDSDGISGWVLPWSALKGSSWDGYHKKYDEKIRELWDLGKLPFPKQAETCVNIVSKTRQRHSLKRKLVKKQGGQILHDEAWDVVKPKTMWEEFAKEYPKEPSGYTNGNNVEARNGATIFPSCLVKIQTGDEKNDNVNFITEASRHPPWKSLGQFRGTVPKQYVHAVLFGENLLPYRISDTPAKIIIPLNEERTGFDESITNQYWKNADDQYQERMGKGSNTPKTLVNRINHGNALLNQLQRKHKHLVICNGAGTWLCASRADSHILINHALFTTEVKTKKEALYLIAVLNSESLQTAYQQSRKSSLNFDTHFWFSVPIPRYDKSNPLHVKIAALAAKAETVAKSVENPNRKSIRRALIKDGVSGEIDKVVRKVLPDHAEKLTKEEALGRL